jgi:hypothetical protein
MGAQPFAAYQDAPANVQALGDVTTRPVYAEFFGADVYLSVHSNASGAADSTAAGTATYRYNCGSFPDHSNDPPPASCDDPAGSDRLQELVHGALIDTFRTQWDPAWRDRRTLVANFGELRELRGIPGILVESAFHDNVRLADGSDLRMTDNQALHDPRWRRLMGDALYRSLSEFLVGPGPLLVPPPTEITARRLDASRVEVAFTAVPGAMSYRIYAASGQRTFDQGRLFTTSPAILDGLPAEAPLSIAIASLNAAGEGRRSKLVAARPSARRAQLLIVDAFDREDAWVQDVDNRGDTAQLHALALAGKEHAFDGATEAAWAAGLIDLAGYDGLVLALGRESTADQILTPALRDAVAAFAAQGKAIFASGSEIGWALGARGDGATQSFLADVFGAAYSADDAASPALRSIPGGRFGAIAAPIPLEDGTGQALQARSSDVLTATAGGAAVLTYDDGASVAAVERGARVLLGVALDSLVDPAQRAAILGGWADAIPLAPIEIQPDAGVPDAELDAGIADRGVVDLDAGASPDAPPGPDAFAADAAAPDAIDPPGALLRAGSPTPVGGGCGCSAAAPRSSAPIAALLLLAWVTRGRSGSRRREPQ